MTTKISCKRVVALGALAPLAFTIAACESDTTVSIGEDGSATIAMEFHDTQGVLEEGGITSCDDFASGLVGPDVDITVEDIATADQMECRITMGSYESVVDGEVLRETDSTYIFEIPEDESDELFGSDDLDYLVSMDFDFTFSVEMPGAIIQADGAQIDGNRATYDDPNFIMSGISVEGYKNPDDSSVTPTEEPTEEPTEDATEERMDEATEDSTEEFSDAPTDEIADAATDGGGFPTWAWILIGLGALAAIGGIVFAVTRKKDDEQDGGGFSQTGEFPKIDGDSPDDKA